MRMKPEGRKNGKKEAGRKETIADRVPLAVDDVPEGGPAARRLGRRRPRLQARKGSD